MVLSLKKRRKASIRVLTCLCLDGEDNDSGVKESSPPDKLVKKNANQESPAVVPKEVPVKDGSSGAPEPTKKAVKIKVTAPRGEKSEYHSIILVFKG